MTTGVQRRRQRRASRIAIRATQLTKQVAALPDIPADAPPTTNALVDVSVVVPALNEAKNLPALARRVADALAGQRYELIVVDDDSRDGTPAVAAELAESFPLRLLVRRQPTDGLSGAVLAGFGVARG